MQPHRLLVSDIVRVRVPAQVDAAAVHQVTVAAPPHRPARSPPSRLDLDDGAKQAGPDERPTPDPGPEQCPARRSVRFLGEHLPGRTGLVTRPVLSEELGDERRQRTTRRPALDFGKGLSVTWRAA